MTLQVVEILGRSQQGRTQPYICRCDDGDVYFVKGRSATRHGLINEWLCAHLAAALGLPIAKFEIVEVPQELIDADLSQSLADLGAGAVFASQKVMGQEFGAAQLADVASALRRDVLVFDWWIRNGDRTLTHRGGNANLLWQPYMTTIEPRDEQVEMMGQLSVIDHNLAFDEEFSEVDFCLTHVFAADLALTFSDFVLRQAYKDRLSLALANLDTAWNNLPPTWHFVDVEQTIASAYPKAQVWQTLRRISQDDFWNLPA
jgi:hypothetical protein